MIIIIIRIENANYLIESSIKSNIIIINIFISIEKSMGISNVSNQSQAIIFHMHQSGRFNGDHLVANEKYNNIINIKTNPNT